MATKYPPYVNAYGKLPELFREIKKASVPTKFTHDFMSTMLGLKSTSFRAMIPLLKNLGFLDQANVPTEAYKQYRDDTMSQKIMADRIRASYPALFTAHEFANKLNKTELTTKLKTMLGAAENDDNLSAVVGTFLELGKLADFENAEGEQPQEKPAEEPDAPKISPPSDKPNTDIKFGLSYTINLNLPATTETEVFNAIFKSLKENILND
jgi:hypothetical protein